ncbi:MAG: hypothetical protein K2O97_14740, partial [Acetatifactor sp.]|nr:hypothetical protein [Acetatifactor sp.]
MVWNWKGEEISQQRYYLHEVCAEQFTSAYCGTIGKWCREHGILSTGHILGEESLAGQAGTVGEAMRCYREFQLPGIDNLCDLREFSSVKQASSVAHQQGREGVLSELYGVTQWDFDFEGYKLAGDWQAALGVTTRVPHLAWASMAGEAKRDYPAAIGWQSPWYRDFRYIEDHFARVNYCLTRGEPMVHVGMIHPIETMWVYQGAAGQVRGRREQLETDFRDITEWLLTNGIDFDYIAESSLEESGMSEDIACIDGTDGFVCGKMKYDVILVPDCLHLRYNTFRRLSRFLENGGKVILCGTKPKYAAYTEDAQLKIFTDRCQWIPVEKSALLHALEPWREIDIKGTDGGRKEFYLHQFRREGKARWLFLAQAYRGLQARQKGVWERRPLHAPEQIVIHIKGCWLVEKYDTLTGEREKLDAEYQDGNTLLQYSLYGDDSLLLHLEPVKAVLKDRDAVESTCMYGVQNSDQKGITDAGAGREYRIGRPTGYRTDEPNVLLLDKFQYALEEEDYSEERELLKADNVLRERLGYPLRMEQVEQPYVR